MLVIDYFYFAFSFQEKLSPPEHTISTPHVSTSPLSVGSTPERGQQHLPPLAASPISPPTSLSLTVNLTTENGAATQNGRTASERNNSEEPEALGPAVPQRRRSKTLGDCPSPLSPTTPLRLLMQYHSVPFHLQPQQPEILLKSRRASHDLC